MASTVTHPMLGSRFALALLHANRLHERQVRKGGREQPYISHLLGVCAVVLEYGGNENEAIGALLHDAVEDQGLTYEEIDAIYGPEVAAIVRGCTDDDFGEPGPHTKQNWRDRKKGYLDHLADETNASVVIVSAADKLCNCRSIARDFREVGENVWERFRGGREGTLWYYVTGLTYALKQARVNHPGNRVLLNLIADYTLVAAELDRDIRNGNSIGSMHADVTESQPHTDVR